MVLADAAKMPVPEYFSSRIYSKLGAQADGEWLLDKNGDAATAEGFGATLRDWARLAMYVRNELSSGTDACFKDYLKEATTRRIGTGSDPNRNFFAGYGYQFWTDNWIAGNTFWMLGYAGQAVGVHPESGKIMVVLSSASGNWKDYFQLFREFTGAN